MSEALLSLDQVTTYYGQMRILEGISLNVREGELVCLLGGNASGKSSTLKTVLGIVRPRSGRVLLDGQDVTQWPVPQRIATGIAIVPENRRLFGQLTVRENLELGVGILVIEHDMHVVAGVSDRVIALDHGVKIAEGSFDEVSNHPSVVEAYLGKDPEALAEA